MRLGFRIGVRQTEDRLRLAVHASSMNHLYFKKNILNIFDGWPRARVVKYTIRSKRSDYVHIH